MQNQHRTDFIVRKHVLRFVIDLINSGWIRLITKVTSAVLVALAIVVMTLIIGFGYSGLQVQVRDDQILIGKHKIGQIYRTPSDQTTKIGRNHLDRDHFTQVTVDAVAGFQNSGIYLKKDDTVRLEPSGRVHLASAQVYTLINLARPIIADKLPTNVSQHNYYKKSYQLKDAKGQVLDLTRADVLEAVTHKNFFRRDWIGPDGEQTNSWDLENCLLYRDNTKWGILLAQVMQETVQDPQLSLKDPFIVLKNNNLQPNDLRPVSDQKEIGFNREGWLTFIVNDAVLSGVERVQPKECKDYYDALLQASNILNQQGNQQGDKYIIPKRLIPLIWYSDNLGAFHVTVRYIDKKDE